MQCARAQRAAPPVPNVLTIDSNFQIGLDGYAYAYAYYDRCSVLFSVPVYHSGSCLRSSPVRQWKGKQGPALHVSNLAGVALCSQTLLLLRYWRLVLEIYYTCRGVLFQSSVLLTCTDAPLICESNESIINHRSWRKKTTGSTDSYCTV